MDFGRAVYMVLVFSLLEKMGATDIPGWWRMPYQAYSYHCLMKAEQLLRPIFQDGLIDNFDVVNFEKGGHRFDVWLDEKKVRQKEDRRNGGIIAYGFGGHHEIRDFPSLGRGTDWHVHKRTWRDRSCDEIFSYDWELSEFGSMCGIVISGNCLFLGEL